MKTLTFLCLNGALVFSPGIPANAQEMMTGEKPVLAPGSMPLPPNSANSSTKSGTRGDEILRRFDKNRDGRLDDDEKADAHDVMLQETMAKEAPVPSAQGLAYFQELAVELFDGNHNGRIDDTEQVDATGFVERGDATATQETLLIRFDRNRDGKLDDFERRESQAFAVEHRGELMRDVLLKRFDSNANGRFEPEEKTAIRAAFMSMPALPKESGPGTDPTPPAKGSRN